MTGKEALIILSKCCSALAFEEGKWKINKRDNEALQTLKEIVVKHSKYKRFFEILKDKYKFKLIKNEELDDEDLNKYKLLDRTTNITISLYKEEYELLEELMGNENTK